ncbi:Protein MS5 [Arabidopsis thaliana x Arabidopsis arenosa]|uniref:Protein MS5 n=1 Tax=Arabidopsis thaliana x Arabidopsis arenosa TaxID=1240361 RepID=A0A8T2DZX2_9BRAS|nr:Protein MS5 [Arabidopsis thaliana x Arabidopsis arenosa]
MPVLYSTGYDLVNLCIGETKKNIKLTDDILDAAFYVLDKSQIEDNAWILLYLELVVATSFRNHITHGLTSLKILKVAMEIPRSPGVSVNMGLDAYDATFYISYKDFCKARVGKEVDRIALVRRILDPQLEILRLGGYTLSSQTIKPSNTMDAGSF